MKKPPNGSCSQTCTKFCPDKAGKATTFCVAAKHLGGTTGGLCTAQCDYAQSKTGCRSGYKCVKLARYNDPKTSKFVCVPGSGGFKGTWCHDQLTKRGVSWSPANNPMATPKGLNYPACNIPDLVYISPTIGGITFRASSPTGSAKKLWVKCPFALAMADMVDALKGKNVTEIIHYGTYNCRVISGTKTLSEHGMANALDIAGFKFKTGAYWTVLKHWEKGAKNPKTAAGTFLRWFADTVFAKKIFNIILTPEFNNAHANHFHVDLTPGANYLKDELPVGSNSCFDGDGSHPH